MKLSRRSFNKLVCTAVAATLGGEALFGLTSAFAQDRVRFTVGHLNSTAHLLAFVAKEEGFFEEEGLDATLIQFSSGAELVAGLESGKLNAAFLGSVPTLVNQSTGHDITIFGGAMSNGHGVVIKPEYTEGLDSWDVTILKGRTIAVPRTTIQELEVLEALEKYGLTYAEDDSADVKIVYFASQSDAYNAHANAEIDAVTTYSPYMSRAVDDGYEIVFNCSDEEIFENQPCCRQVALTDELADNSQTYVQFERALIKAYDFYRNNPDETVRDVQVYIPIDEELIEYELYSGHYADSNPDPDKQATQKLKEGAVAFGYLEDFDLDTLYNTSVYEQALESLLKEDPDNPIYAELKEHFDSVE